MKTLEEILEEIKFHESEYDRLSKVTQSNISELSIKIFREIMGRHDARRQALMWVIGK